MTTAAENLLMKTHASVCAASKALDSAVSAYRANLDKAVANFRIDSNDENLRAVTSVDMSGVIEAGRIYAHAQMESSGIFCDVAQGLPLGTTNARLDALEAKHTPQPLRLVLAAVANGATGIFAEMDGEM